MGDKKGTNQVLLHGGLLKTHTFSNAQHLSIWIHLLLLANQKEENDFVWNDEIVTQKPGQLITGRKKLSELTGVKESTIEHILDRLEVEHHIEQQKTSKYRLITIVDWGKYQPLDNTLDTIGIYIGKEAKREERGERDIGIEDSTTIPNDNILPTSSPKINFVDFWNIYPNKDSKKLAEAKWNRLPKTTQKIIMEDIPKRKKSHQWIQDGGEYVPMASTYINQERWNDEIRLTSKANCKDPMKNIDTSKYNNVPNIKIQTK